MDKDNQIIMAIEKDTLFKDRYFTGFSPAESYDYESVILKNYQHIKRGVAEKEPSYKQPIAYAIMINPLQQSVFTYQRASHKSHYDEKRLMGKWSWGVGGHIEPADSFSGNPIHDSMERELLEETEFKGKLTSKVLGYINDDTTEVGTVHFGILYIVETNSEWINPKCTELAEGKLRKIKELDTILSDPDHEVEEWSRIALGPLKKYIGHLRGRAKIKSK